MITIITGAPGHGKTLHTIWLAKQLVEETGRPIYQSGLTDLSLDWETLDDPKEAHNCPEGSIIIIDECWEFFKVRKVGSDVPSYIELFATHRHRGHDFFLITQHGTQIDTFVRKMCGRHIHVDRKFGLERSTVLEWNRVRDPANHFDRKDALITQWKFPKELFGVYKSAEIHTVKNNFPIMKVAMLGAGVVAVIAFGFIGFNSIGNLVDEDEAEPVAEESTSSPSSFMPAAFRNQRLDDKETLPAFPIRRKLYAQETWDRYINDIPYSADVYDQLINPVSFPKIAGCSRMQRSNGTDTCKCTSQQGTALRISYRACRDIMENGWFDFTESTPYYPAYDAYNMDNSNQSGAEPSNAGGATANPKNVSPGSPTGERTTS